MQLKFYIWLWIYSEYKFQIQIFCTSKVKFREHCTNGIDHSWKYKVLCQKFVSVCNQKFIFDYGDILSTNFRYKLCFGISKTKLRENCTNCIDHSRK